MKKKLDDMLLNPNCSEAVFKLDGKEFRVSTDWGESIEIFAEELISMKDDLQEEPFFEFVENNGGGANFEEIETVITLFTLLKKGELTEEEFKKVASDVWSYGKKPDYVDNKYVAIKEREGIRIFKKVKSIPTPQSYLNIGKAIIIGNKCILFEGDEAKWTDRVIVCKRAKITKKLMNRVLVGMIAKKL